MADKVWIVKKEMKLLDYLVQYSGINKKTVRDLIGQGLVLVNQEMTRKANELVKEGDEITISNEAPKPKKKANFEILYEDEDLIAINKPSGLLSISTSSEKEKTAYHMVREYLLKQDAKMKIFVIHRLDKDTSGVLMFAKNEKIKKMLQDQWNDIVKVRGYMAKVEGVLEKDEDTLKDYLAENKSFQVYVTNAKQGKLAITKYKVVKRYKDATLIEINLETGRKNQIRVQMANIHHPLIGDVKYNPSKSSLRLCLHAHQLGFIDPRTNKYILIEAKSVPFA